MRTVLVTGGLGFIGSHLIKVLLHDTTDRIINIDRMTYAAMNGSRFPGWPKKTESPWWLPGARRARFSDRHIWYDRDIVDPRVPLIFHEHTPDAVVHLAAESHVDRSLDGGKLFVHSNLLGTHRLLDCCLKNGTRFIYVSTDEVYGPWELGECGIGFTEDDMLDPRNPYAATKAGAEHLVMAYHYTYGLPVCITRGCNTYGTHQHPEKFLPLFILNAMEGKPLPLYGDGNQVREWLHVRDHVDAILHVLDHGKLGEVYNIGSGERHKNLDVANAICEKLGKPYDLIKHVKDRPGHDRMYAIVPTRLEEEGWRPQQRKFLSGEGDGLSVLADWYTGDEGQDWCAWADNRARDRRGLRKEEEES